MSEQRPRGSQGLGELGVTNCNPGFLGIGTYCSTVQCCAYTPFIDFYCKRAPCVDSAFPRVTLHFEDTYGNLLGVHSINFRLPKQFVSLSSLLECKKWQVHPVIISPRVAQPRLLRSAAAAQLCQEVRPDTNFLGLSVLPTGYIEKVKKRMNNGTLEY